MAIEYKIDVLKALKEAGYRVIDAEDVGKELQLCFLVVCSSGKQCSGST